MLCAEVPPHSLTGTVLYQGEAPYDPDTGMPSRASR